VPTSPIAVNASIIGDRPSGVGQYAQNLIDALDELGCRLSIHASPRWLVRRDRGAIRHVARLLWCQTTLRRRVARERSLVLLNPIPEGVLRCGVRQVTVLHDVIPLAFPHAFPRQRWYFRRFVPAVLRESCVVITVSEATRAQAIAAYGLAPDRVRTIPCGYDAARFCPDGDAVADDGVPYVLFVGNILPHKNLARLVDAFASVVRHVPARLVIVGKGRPGQVARLEARAAATGVPLELRSYVSPAELPALYRGARLVVLPSLAEGFGLTALEAMASGTPVVAASTSSLPEVVGDAGVLVDPRDIRSIAEGIVRVLTDDMLREDLIARGLARASRFSWERTAREVRAVLDEVARR